MDTASFSFILFGLAVAIAVNLRSDSAAWRSSILLLSSLIFLAVLAPNLEVLLPFAGFLLLGYSAIALRRREVLQSTALSVVVIGFVYVWLKKYTFLPAGLFIRYPYFTIGLSYVFFRVLHLVIEAGENSLERDIGPFAFLTYTLNFTTLVSGPIQRYEGFVEDQFAEKPIPLDASIIGSQLERIVRGFFKVNVVALLFNIIRADSMARLAQPLPWPQKALAALELAAAYPFFLYCNFSGYIDIVIALARLLRLRLPENFDRPFSAASFLDFWNRWHITLSRWLKTYVFNPLFMALIRRMPSKSLQPWLGVFSFFVTFFLVGLWHGRTSEFLIFGLLQGGGVAANKLWQLLLARFLGRKQYTALSANSIYIAAARGLTFCWFAFTLFWFWGSWVEIHAIFGSLGTWSWLGVWCSLWLAASLLLAFWEALRSILLGITFQGESILTSRYARVVYATVFALVGFAVTAVLSQPAPDIVYKAF